MRRLFKGKQMRTGNCLQCGRCCQTKFLLKGIPFQVKIVLNIIAFLKGKRIRATDKCCFLAFEKGKAYCRNYAGRPDFCRAYPVEPGDLIENCGYSFTDYDNVKERTKNIGWKAKR